ncbi:MAG: efflux RND transporter periplasmic adaptor subunit [Proteobacteria bacterium]|nr:efflux RND transporter periplasmic adaptor subunit [Pseudomonadota bacterium]
MNHSDSTTSSRRWLTLWLPLLLLAVGAAAAFLLLSTKPSAGRARTSGDGPLLVQTQAVQAEDKAVTIMVMGTVSAAREIELRSRVAGHIQELSASFTPGGLLRAGQLALSLDDIDYRLAARQAENAVARTRADLDLEMGQQRVARAQLDMLPQSSSEALDEASLALREPQLVQARADLDDAEANLAQARLDLERTRVKSPFNALVTQRSVNLGSDISTTDTLGTLVGTDEYWVEAVVPVDQLRWINFSTDKQAGSPAEIFSRSRPNPRQGQVLHRIGALVESSRMARVLISIPDPLGLKDDDQPLVLNEYVSVRITGPTINGVVSLPREALREGTLVWVATGDTLDIRPVTVAWSDSDTIHITSGLTPGERVITTDIASPVQGMSLRVQGKEDENVATGTDKGSRHDG